MSTPNYESFDKVRQVAGPQLSDEQQAERREELDRINDEWSPARAHERRMKQKAGMQP